MPNSFDPGVGGVITRQEAEEWIANYDRQFRNDKEHDTRSVFFGKDFLQKILDTEGASGISFFLTRKPGREAGKEIVDLVLLPTTKEGKLLWPSFTEGKDGPEEGAYDKSTICPPDCPQE
jgi:hypothetical protein